MRSINGLSVQGGIEKNSYCVCQPLRKQMEHGYIVNKPLRLGSIAQLLYNRTGVVTTNRYN